LNVDLTFLKVDKWKVDLRIMPKVDKSNVDLPFLKVDK
jgi:hypothetical protein